MRRAKNPGWKPLLPHQLCVLSYFPQRFTTMRLPETAEYRRTASGFAVRWSSGWTRRTVELPTTFIDGAGETLAVIHAQRASDVRQALEEILGAGRQQDDPDPEAIFLALMVAERERLAVPRGATAKATEWTLILRAAAQQIHEEFALNQLFESRMGEPVVLEPWMEALRRQAAEAGVGATPAELTAFALTRYAEIDWPAIGLKPPMRDGEVEVEYFRKQYLDAEVTTNPEGRAIAQRIEEQLAPPRRRPAGVRPLDVADRRLLDRKRQRFHLMLDQLGSNPAARRLFELRNRLDS